MNKNLPKLLKFAIAAFMHDIGKFSQRAAHSSPIDGSRAFYLDKEFENTNKGLFQPFYKKINNYTHRHALYTAAFIDHLEKILPEKLNQPDSDLGEGILTIAACHHKPETPLQQIVTIADRLSSGLERDSYEDFDWSEGQIQKYLYRQMISVFDTIGIENVQKRDMKDNKSYNYRLPISELSAKSSFPIKVDDVENKVKGPLAYQTLFQKFVSSLENLYHKNQPELWFEHFESLFMLYASQIPAATVGKIVPDISLYDHSRTTAAIATAIYAYHLNQGHFKNEHDELNIERLLELIKDNHSEKLLLIQGDFYGIQKFIFSSGGKTNKFAAKLLRGRSFYVNLLTELAADMILRETGLPSTSVIMNAAGKFVILASNDDPTIEAVKRCETKINNWLIKNFYGENAVGFTWLGIKPSDLLPESFIGVWGKLSKNSNMKKFNRFKISELGGPFEDYLEQIPEGGSVCAYCGKRPGTETIWENAEPACSICRDQVKIGEALVKSSRIAICSKEANLKGARLLTPIFGEYQVSFDTTGKLAELASAKTLIKLWDITNPDQDNFTKECAVKFINGYIPVFNESDQTDDRLIALRKKEEKVLEAIDQIESGNPKTFSHISINGIKRCNLSDGDKYCGITALGVFKADVDKLGTIFAQGLKKDRRTISRIATLSRQLNFFFAGYLPFIFKNDHEMRFQNIYTVFAGGDDLFVIGPWNEIKSFSSFIQQKFSHYCCLNPEITISAGLCLQKPNCSIERLADETEQLLDKAKNDGRNRISLFGRSLEWQKFNELEKICDELNELVAQQSVSTSVLYKWCSLSNDAEREANLKEKNKLGPKDIEALKWKSKFKYLMVRQTKSDKEQMKDFESFCHYIQKYRGDMIVPLWFSLYAKRKYS